MPLTEAHRVLITYLRAVRSVSAPLLTEKFKRIAEHFEIDTKDEPAAKLREYISDLNVRLERYSFKIEAARDQVLGEAVYVFVNTKADSVIQGCTPYSPSELDAIKQMIDSIISSDFEFCLPYGNAKQQVASVAKLRLNDADFFLTRLVNDGWINITSNSRVVLSTATLAELKTYLIDRFGIFSPEDPLGKLLSCNVCGDLVTYGIKCPSEVCHVSFHNKCFTVFSRQNPDLKCLYRNCDMTLNRDLLIDIGADP